MFINQIRMLVLILLIVLFNIDCGVAQQRTLQSQYMFNILVINPAFAGADDALSVNLSHRRQWSGMEGSPQTVFFSAHTLFEPKKLGAGVALISDKIGVHKNLGVNVSAAYHLPVASESTLSFGLQGELRNQRSDYTMITGSQPNDPRLSSSGFRETWLNIGAGVFFKNKRIQAGVSLPGLLNNNSALNDTTTTTTIARHLLTFVRYSVPVTKTLTFIPSVFVQQYPGLPLTIDLNAGLLIHDVLFTGLSYRKSESIDFLLRAGVTPQLSIGYSYDVVLGKASRVASASHEVTVNYLFKFVNHKVDSPR